MSLFSPRQREWLEAMGLSTYSHVDPCPALEPPANAAVDTAPPQSRLQAALARATRGRPRLLADLGIDAAALREDPAAKRALWHRLRRARRTPA